MTKEVGNLLDCRATQSEDGVSGAETRIMGIVIVSYESGDYLLQCLESLLSSECTEFRIVVCDNASPDSTVKNLQLWASGEKEVPGTSGMMNSPAVPIEKPFSIREFSEKEAGVLNFDQLEPVTIVRLDNNLGYAGAVNVGLSILKEHSEIDAFWVLNPDCITPPETVSNLRQFLTAKKPCGLVGGRILYAEPPNLIQSDGGYVSPWTGVCRNLNSGVAQSNALLPEKGMANFISGAHMVVTRPYLHKVGLMPENYFLYYEEVDWASQGGDLPIDFCSGAIVYHHGGTSIGSGTATRRPSMFSNYFNYRNRMRYMWRFHPARIPFAFGYSVLKILSLLGIGAWGEAYAAITGLLGLQPPAIVRTRLSAESAKIAFGIDQH